MIGDLDPAVRQAFVLKQAMLGAGQQIEMKLREVITTCGSMPVVVLPSFMTLNHAAECRSWVLAAGGTPVMAEELSGGAEAIEILPLPAASKFWLTQVAETLVVPHLSDTIEFFGLTSRGEIHRLQLGYDFKHRTIYRKAFSTLALSQDAAPEALDCSDGSVDHESRQRGLEIVRPSQQAGEATARVLARAAAFISGNEWAIQAWLGDLDCGPFGRETPYPTWRKILYATGLLVVTGPLMRLRRLTAQVSNLAVRLFDKWLFSSAPGVTLGAVLIWLGIQSFQSAGTSDSTKAGVTAAATTLAIVSPPMAWTIGWLRRQRRPHRTKAPRR
ncbi:hypothetical protein [Catenulispora subtropica]|uniref:Uncharacterized protein n=1 Tax=Catenulispora subtropica TaxID=450798 RepID=A0ABP5CGX1_9ACTN